MKTKKSKQTKAYEFFTLFIMVIGTVIGAGIYLKNKEIVGQTHNPIIAILLWIIVGAVCLVAVSVFFEVASSTAKTGNGTIGNWSKIFINRKTASYLAILHAIVWVPVYYTLFVGMFIFFFMQAIRVQFTWQQMLAIYLIVGIVLIFAFSVLSGLSLSTARAIQVFGTIFKFIPLIIALVAGFAMIPNGAMFNDGYNPPGNNEALTWSISSWDFQLFFRGFGGVLLAFDGFIFLANVQKDFKHKSIVPLGIFMGIGFAAIFYVLMATSLLLGSPDGSIVTLFEKIIEKISPGNAKNAAIASTISNLLLATICFLNMNLFAMVGVQNMKSDFDAKILYAGARTGRVSIFKASLIQAILASFVFIVFVLMGFFIEGRALSGGMDNGIPVKMLDGTMKESFAYQSEAPIKYISIMSSINGVVSFFVIDMLIIAAMVNRKTKKVEVEKNKYMMVCAWISSIAISIIVVSGIYTFLDPNNGAYGTGKDSWVQSSGFWFLILFSSLLTVVTILFFIQEKMFKLHPFKDGFEGQMLGEDPHPYTFKINLKENYFNKKPKKVKIQNDKL